MDIFIGVGWNIFIFGTLVIKYFKIDGVMTIALVVHTGILYNFYTLSGIGWGIFNTAIFGYMIIGRIFFVG